MKDPLVEAEALLKELRTAPSDEQSRFLVFAILERLVSAVSALRQARDMT